MAKYKSGSLDNAVFVPVDRIRRDILVRLAEGASSVSNLAAPFDISLPAISRYLRILKNAGLVSHEKDGRMRRCALDAGSLRGTLNWIEI